MWVTAKPCGVFLFAAALSLGAAEVPSVSPDSLAQTLAPPPPTEAAAAPPKISYVGGQLTIDARNSSLGDLLAKVAAATGAKIDIPDGANTQMIPIARLGPGSARQVLAWLLSDAHFDFVIQASDADPDKLETVLIMARKTAPGDIPVPEVVANSSRSRYAALVQRNAEAEAAPPEVPVAAQRDSATDPNALTPPIPTDAGGFAAAQREQPGLANASTLGSPQTQAPQNINQQLMQMYQQRAQMIQQSRPVSQPAVPQ